MSFNLSAILTIMAYNVLPSRSGDEPRQILYKYKQNFHSNIIYYWYMVFTLTLLFL